MLSAVSNGLIKNTLSLINSSKVKNIKNTHTTNKLVERLIRELFQVLSLTAEYLSDIPQLRNSTHIHVSNNGNEHNIRKFLHDNKYLNSSIYQFIKKSDCIAIKYHFNFGREYVLNFYVYDKMSMPRLHKLYDKYARHVMTLLFFLEKYRSAKCKSNKLEVVFFMTPFEKTFPDIKSQTLGPEHINGGYTIPCQHHSKIFIWRTEELLKVLIHESIHSMGIDLSTMNLDKIHNNIKTLFPMNPEQTEFNIGEAYTEFWTEIINIVYYVVLYANSLKSKPTLTSLVKRFDQLYFVEKVWGFSRSLIILDHMGLTYADLVSRNPDKLRHYKEQSNFFSYFIMKMVFMHDHNKFIELCMKNNADILLVSLENSTNEKILNKMFLYIKQHYMTKELMENYEILYESISTGSRAKSYKKFMTSSRMSCIDYL